MICYFPFFLLFDLTFQILGKGEKTSVKVVSIERTTKEIVRNKNKKNK